MRTRVASRNTALQNLGDELDNGFVRFYDGPQPTDPDTALAGNTLIVELALSDPAMGVASAGTRPFNSIGAALTATAGTPTFARFVRADGSTAVVDMRVPDEISLSKETWAAGELFTGPSVTWNMPVECL